jgi:putative SOS response-associated peptidase YedK
MCYDIKASLDAQLKRAKHYGDQQAIREIEEKRLPLTDLPLFHTTGFMHPKLLIYTERSPYIPEVATWGLVPHWVKDNTQRRKFWNNTLNARGETVFEKPAFRDAARYHRCIIPVDGFYEHHHHKGNTYPFFIHRGDREPLSLAGIWNSWTDPESGEAMLTFSIVTTTGNSMMAHIHNNPKIEGPRMPLILPEEIEDQWLKEVEDEVDLQALEELIQPYPQDALDAYTVPRLRGKEYMGNVPEINREMKYPELDTASH